LKRNSVLLMDPAGRMYTALAKGVNMRGDVWTGRRGIWEVRRHDEAHAHCLACEPSRLDKIVEDDAVTAVRELRGL
jgi:hypothetical protein